MEGTPSKMPATGAALAEAAAAAGACVILWGGKSGGRRGGCSSIGYHCAMGAGSVGRRGGDRGGRLEKVLLIVTHILQQRTQIDHRVSVVLPDDGERLTFGGAKGVRRRRSGHRPQARVCCDAAYATPQPVSK